MKHVNSISQEGTAIIYSNLSNLDQQSAITAMQNTVKLFAKMPLKSIHSLINMEGLELTRELISQIRAVGIANSPYTKATAICGLNPMARFLANSAIKLTKRNAKLFATIEEGKAWLHEENQRFGMEELIKNRKIA